MEAKAIEGWRLQFEGCELFVAGEERKPHKERTIDDYLKLVEVLKAPPLPLQRDAPALVADEIKRLLDEGASYTLIGRRMGINRKYIGKFVHKMGWA